MHHLELKLTTINLSQQFRQVPHSSLEISKSDFFEILTRIQNNSSFLFLGAFLFIHAENATDKLTLDDYRLLIHTYSSTILSTYI